jgi:CRP-like cAMP-binding protein
VLEQGSFFGEGCLAGQPLRMATASADQASSITRVKPRHAWSAAPSRARVRGALHRVPALRNVRIEEDLVDQLFNSSEKRLARILLLLAHFGKEPRPETVIPKVSQETLAAMVGTTRSRVSYFMNRFRKLGFIHYNGGLQVHSALLSVVLHD